MDRQFMTERLLLLPAGSLTKEPNCVMLFQIFIDPDDNTLYENDIAEYVVEKNSVVYG